jgi:hypothetical protein
MNSSPAYRPARSTQRGAHIPQHVVALKMTERVIHRLEGVDVDHRECEGGSACGCVPNPRGGLFDEPAAKEQSGELVARCAGRPIDRRCRSTLVSTPGFSGIFLAPRPEGHDLVEELEQARVELPPDVTPHELHRLFMRKRLLVAPFRRQGVIDVGEADHARHERDLFAGESFRISRTIPRLVM